MDEFGATFSRWEEAKLIASELLSADKQTRAHLPPWARPLIEILEEIQKEGENEASLI
jgi:hypothetical protein